MKPTHYIWQSRQWPKFTWDNSRLLNPLGECRRKQGMLLAKVSSLGLPYEQQAQTDILFEEAMTTSAIEGEKLNPAAVRSSIARKLGLPSAGLPVERVDQWPCPWPCARVWQWQYECGRARAWGWAGCR